MIILASIEAIALVVVVYLMLRYERAAEAAWSAERRELLNRVQAPERIPVREDAGDYVIPERMPDEWNKVGEISIDPEYGLKEEVEFLG